MNLLCDVIILENNYLEVREKNFLDSLLCIYFLYRLIRVI